MPRYKRPHDVKRSERWLRVAVNDAPAFTNEKIRSAFGWPAEEMIEWRSPIKSDQYTEYGDDKFLKRLGIRIEELAVPLRLFWPRNGPRWDGLARSSSRKFLLVEAKAYIEESVYFGSKARNVSRMKIDEALEESKQAYAAAANANWASPFYQYANRLAHLHFLVSKNKIDGYLIFLYFANAPDVPSSCTAEQWEGATRLTEKCLGLGRHVYRDRIATIVIDVAEMLAQEGVLERVQTREQLRPSASGAP